MPHRAGFQHTACETWIFWDLPGHLRSQENRLRGWRLQCVSREEKQHPAACRKSSRTACSSANLDFWPAGLVGISVSSTQLRFVAPSQGKYIFPGVIRPLAEVHFSTDWAVRAVAIPRHALREPSCPVVLFLPRHQPAPCRESRRFPLQLSKPPRHQLWAQLSNAAFLRISNPVLSTSQTTETHQVC